MRRRFHISGKYVLFYILYLFFYIYICVFIYVGSEIKDKTNYWKFQGFFWEFFKIDSKFFQKKLRNLTDSARKKLDDVFEGNVARFGERKTITTSEENLLNISNHIFDIKILCDKGVNKL